MTSPTALTSPPSASAPRRHDRPPPRHVSRLPAGWIVDALLVILIVVVATVVRVVFLSSRVPAFVTPDSDDYLWPGYALAHGLGFEPELRRTPLYPVFIAAVIGLGGTLSTIVIVQHVLGIVTA